MPITDYYVASDAMGSVTAILDEDGNVLERRTYDAFGEMTCMTSDGTPVTESPTGVDVGFQGQVRDEVTGLYQMGYRWYNPVLGRWISRDPIGVNKGANLAVSFGNAPEANSDKLGLMFFIEYVDSSTGGTVNVEGERAAEFKSAVKRCSLGCIVSIRFTGHGSPSTQGLDDLDNPKDLLEVNGNQNEIFLTSSSKEGRSKDKLSDLLKGKLRDGCTVGLEGCYAATNGIILYDPVTKKVCGETNICELLSKELPRVHVYGYDGQTHDISNDYLTLINTAPFSYTPHFFILRKLLPPPSQKSRGNCRPFAKKSYYVEDESGKASK